MTKTIDDSNVKYIYKSLDTNDKFLNPIWMWGQNNTRLTLYMGAESKYPKILSININVYQFLLDPHFFNFIFNGSGLP